MYERWWYTPAPLRCVKYQMDGPINTFCTNVSKQTGFSRVSIFYSLHMFIFSAYYLAYFNTRFHYFPNFIKHFARVSYLTFINVELFKYLLKLTVIQLKLCTNSLRDFAFYSKFGFAFSMQPYFHSSGFVQ